MTDVKLNDGTKEIETRGKLKIPDAFLASNNVTPNDLSPRPKIHSSRIASDVMKKPDSENLIKTETKQTQEPQVKQENMSPKSPKIVTKKEKCTTDVNILEALIKTETKPTQAAQVKQENESPKSPRIVKNKEKCTTGEYIFETTVKTETKPTQELQVKQENMSPQSPRVFTKKEKGTTGVNMLETLKPIPDRPKKELVKELESEPVEIESQDTENSSVEYEYKPRETSNGETLDLYFSSPVIEQPSNQFSATEVKVDDTVQLEKIQDTNELNSQYQAKEASPKTIRNQVIVKQETNTNLTKNNKLETTIIEKNSQQESVMASDNQIKEKIGGDPPRPPRPAKRSIANLMKSANQLNMNDPKEKTKIDSKQLLERSKNALITPKSDQTSGKNTGKIKEKDFKDRVKNFDDL